MNTLISFDEFCLPNLSSGRACPTFVCLYLNQIWCWLLLLAEIFGNPDVAQKLAVPLPFFVPVESNQRRFPPMDSPLQEFLRQYPRIYSSYVSLRLLNPDIINESGTFCTTGNVASTLFKIIAASSAMCFSQLSTSAPLLMKDGTVFNICHPAHVAELADSVTTACSCRFTEESNIRDKTDKWLSDVHRQLLLLSSQIGSPIERESLISLTNILFPPSLGTPVPKDR